MQNLPGQIISSNDEENLFENNQGGEYLNSNQDEINNLNQEENKVYKFLGFKFLEQILKQRNKNPLLLLCLVFLFDFIWPVTFILTYIWTYNETDNNIQYIITLLLCITSIVFGFFTTIFFLQLSLQNGIKLNLKEWIFTLLTIIFIAALFIYSLIYLTPFGSLGIYMIPSFVNIFLISFVWVLGLTKNSIPLDTKNYQLKFFSQRILTAFFTAVAVLDIYSDFALSVQAVRDQYDVSLVIILGPALVIFGVIDLVLFVLSVRFSVYSCIVVNKIILIVIIAFTLLYLREDSLFLGWFGMATTVISFVYYIFKCCSGRQVSEKELLIENS